MSGVEGWRKRAQAWEEVEVEVEAKVWWRRQDVARLGPRRAGHHSQEAMVVGGLRYSRMAHRA